MKLTKTVKNTADKKNILSHPQRILKNSGKPHTAHNLDKNLKSLEESSEPKERHHKLDERLVPFWLGSDTKNGNIALRDALIKLGKTAEMTHLFGAMKTANMGYRDESDEIFIQALYSIIRGHDEISLMHVLEDDIKAIYYNNLKKFNEFWDSKAETSLINEEDNDD